MVRAKRRAREEADILDRGSGRGLGSQTGTPPKGGFQCLRGPREQREVSDVPVGLKEQIDSSNRDREGSSWPGETSG